MTYGYINMEEIVGRLPLQCRTNMIAPIPRGGFQCTYQPLKSHSNVVLFEQVYDHSRPTNLLTVEIRSETLSRSHLMTFQEVMFDHNPYFKEHVDHVMTKGWKGLSATRVLAAANIEQTATASVPRTGSFSQWIYFSFSHHQPCSDWKTRKGSKWSHEPYFWMN